MTLSNPGITIVAYASNSWETSLGVLRIVGPFHYAGIRLVRGNFGDVAYPEYVSQGDAVLIQRDFPRYRAVYEQVVANARASGKPVIYDLDDLLLELPPDHPDRVVYYYTDALLPILKAIAEADLVTVSAPPLEEYIRHLNPSVCTLSNYLNDQIWKFVPPRPPSQTNRPIVINYMGGQSHTPDLQCIAPAFLNLFQRYNNQVQLHLYGVPPPPELASHPNVIHTPFKTRVFTDFAAHFQSQEYDIAIAPLVENRFNRCKSGVKYLEYSALGLPGVYSRLEPYQGMIEQGVNGFLASSLEEWEDCLVRLVESPILRYQIALNAQEKVARDWLLSKNAHHWREAYQTMIRAPNKAVPVAQREPDLYISIVDQVLEWQDYIKRQECAQAQDRENACNELKVARMEAERQLAEIYKSKVWKAVLFLRRVRLSLFPLGSQREQFGVLAKRGLGSLFRDGPFFFIRKLLRRVFRRN